MILTNSLVKRTSDTVTMHCFNMLTGLILRAMDFGVNVTPCNVNRPLEPLTFNLNHTQCIDYLIQTNYKLHIKHCQAIILTPPASNYYLSVNPHVNANFSRITSTTITLISKYTDEQNDVYYTTKTTFGTLEYDSESTDFRRFTQLI